jgi:hypothetical protein
MTRRSQLYLLAALAVVLVVVYFMNRNAASSGSGVLAADGAFQPLAVHEPQLRLDLLANLTKLVYTGTHRDIFSAVPPPPEPTAAEIAARKLYPTVPVKPPDPPLTIPGQLYGYATSKSGGHVAFFTNGDDILVVPEGDTFLSRFRLTHIGVDSADVMEISTGRHAVVPMLLPTPPASGAGDANPPANNPGAGPGTQQ